MEVREMENNHVSGNKMVHVNERVDRLLRFLNKYKELWYENGRSVEEKITRMTDNKEEQAHILELYKQAEDDYAALRPIRTRFYGRIEGKHSTPAYKIDENQIDRLTQAGIGRAFGLSDENQKEYDRLVKAGVDEEIVQFIFRKFTNYQRFKEVFCEAMELGREADLFKKCYKANSLYISDIDLSSSNGIRETDRGCVELLRDVLGVKYFVFDGTRLVERINEFINQEERKTRRYLTDNERDITCKMYGIGTEKMSSEQIRKEMGISNSRVRQILKSALEKLSKRKSQLTDIVYLSDENEVVNFFISYFKKNDIFRSKKANNEHKKSEQSGERIEVQDIGLNEELYSSTFAKKLKVQMNDLENDRSMISDMLKAQLDTLLDNFEKIKIKDFYLGKTLIDRFNLSVRTQTSLSKKGICTIGDVIEYSRRCQTSMKKNIKNMGDKSFDEFKVLIDSLGLILEDEDKSDKTRIHNDRILNHLSEKDVAKFALYFEQIRYNAHSSIMKDDSIKEIESRINSIKDDSEITISGEELSQNIRSRISKLDYSFDYDSGIDNLDLPDEVVRVFKLHGIDKILDIYRLRDRDIDYIKKRFGAYFDMVVFELNRIGFEYPLRGKSPNNMMKYATYMNRRNIELIMFLIDEANNISNEEKEKLKEELFDKIKQVEKKDDEEVDAKLSAKIKNLQTAYKTLMEKEEELSNMEIIQEMNNPDNQDLDI